MPKKTGTPSREDILALATPKKLKKAIMKFSAGKAIGNDVFALRNQLFEHFGMEKMDKAQAAEAQDVASEPRRVADPADEAPSAPPEAQTHDKTNESGGAPSAPAGATAPEVGEAGDSSPRKEKRKKKKDKEKKKKKRKESTRAAGHLDDEGDKGRGTAEPAKASASDKPKRPANAYLLFGNEERDVVLKDNPDIAHKDIMVELGKRWKQVDAKRKAALEAEAAKLKKVYDEKLAQWKLSKVLPVQKQKPKRPASAYILFGKEERDVVLKDIPDIDAKEVMTELGKRWRQLDPERKEALEAESAKLWTNYEEELAQWKLDNEADKPSTSDSPEVNGEEVSKTPKKRKKKHDSDRDDGTAGSAKSKSKASASDKPKRPGSAYILFGNEERGAIAKDNPDFAQKDVMAELGKRWKQVDAKRKAALEAEAAKLKKVYDEKLAQWKLDNEADKPSTSASVAGAKTVDPEEASKTPKKVKDKERTAEGDGKDGAELAKSKSKASASDKPKRPATAYILFGNGEREAVTKDNPDIAHKDIMVELGKRWKQVDAKRKAALEAEAAKLKKVYDEKLAQWKLDNEADKPSTSASVAGAKTVDPEEASKTPKKVKDKERTAEGDGKDGAELAKSKSKASASDKPKRPATAYILFGNGEREAVTKDNPDIAHKDIMVELGKRWKQVDAKRKAALEAEAAKLKKVYDEKLAQWKLDNEAAGKQVVPGSIVRTIHTDEISTMGNREVNKELKRLGLSKEGTLEERRERLLEHRGEKVKKKQSDPSSKTPAKTKGAPGKRKRRATGSNVYDCAFSSTHTTYFKGCVWSPCGSSLLAASDDKCVRTYDLPKGIFSGGASKKSPQPLEAYEKFPVGDLIYDYAWYPKMRAADVATCCYAVTSHAKPVQLIDSARGTLRCVYKVHDSGDELISAHSLAFSLEGDTLIGGFDGLVALWSLERPGKDPLSTHSMAQHSQSGKISTMNVNTYHPTLVACGCYDGTIGIYDTRGGAWDKLDVVQGHKGGVTQVQFSKCGNFVYSGARKDSSIHCWDMRNLSASLHTMSRPGVERTNQTIGFDITPLNTHLMTGGADGKVLVYDLKTSELVETFQASSDAVNGVSIHPYIPVVATASGEREYGGGFFSDSSTEELLGSAPAAGVSGDRNSLRLWRPSVPYETEGWRDGIVKRASYGA